MHCFINMYVFQALFLEYTDYKRKKAMCTAINMNNLGKTAKN